MKHRGIDFRKPIEEASEAEKEEYKKIDKLFHDFKSERESWGIPVRKHKRLKKKICNVVPLMIYIEEKYKDMLEVIKKQKKLTPGEVIGGMIEKYYDDFLKQDSNL